MFVCFSLYYCVIVVLQESGLSKSVLFVTSNTKKLSNACNAIPGVDVQSAKHLSVLDLAPGGAPIRLVVYSKNALQEIEKIKSTHLELMVNIA